MNTQDLHSFTDELHKTMMDKLNNVSLENQDVLTRLSRSQTIIQNTLTSLKSFIHTHSFKNISEEILFFKEIKPLFLGQYYYHQRLLALKTREPVGNKERLHEFYRKELHKIQTYLRNNIAFHLYCLSGATHLDELYFLRPSNPTEPFLDEKFTTTYDTIQAKIIANELVKEHLLALIQKINIEEKASLSWTGPKTALIELAYALHSLEVFNNGKTDLKQIASTFENLFNISLGNYYRVFQEIRLRKSGRTNFLDQLKEKFIQRMDNMD